MLSEKETAFMERWERDRERESGLRHKLLSGLPMALIFFLPVPLFLLGVYLMLPEWYARISNQAPGAMITIMIAMLAGVVFYSFFRMQFKWEMNEELYLRLKRKKETESQTI